MNEFKQRDLFSMILIPALEVSRNGPDSRSSTSDLAFIVKNRSADGREMRKRNLIWRSSSMPMSHITLDSHSPTLSRKHSRAVNSRHAE